MDPNNDLDQRQLHWAGVSHVNQEIVEIYGIGSWYLDLGSSDLFWSPRTRDIHEVPPDYVPTVERAIEFYDPAARPVVAQAVEGAIQYGTSWDLELPMITAAGKSIWVRTVGKAIRERGQTTVLLGAFEDISETKKQSIALQAMLDNFPGGVIRYDEKHVLQSCNAELVSRLALPKSLIDSSPTMLDILRFTAERGDFGPGEPEALAQKHFGLMTSGKPVTYERVAPNGTVLEIRGMPQPDGGVVAIVSDVTVYKRVADLLKQEARQSSERLADLQVIIASMSQGVSVFNDQGELVVWNQQYIDIFRKPTSEVTFKTTLNQLIEAEKNEANLMAMWIATLRSSSRV